MDTINCERDELQRIEIPVTLLADFARSFVHLVRGHLSVVSNDLEYFSTLLPNEVDGSTATTRSSRRISETVELLEIISALTLSETPEHLEKLLHRFFVIIGATEEEITQSPSESRNHTSFVISKHFPHFTELSFHSAVELAKKSVGEKGVVIAAVIDLILAAQGLSLRATRTSSSAPFEVVINRFDGTEK